MRFGEVGVIFEGCVQIDIQRDPRSSRCRYMPNNACLTHPQAVSPCQHSSATLTIGGAQNGVLMLIVQEEDAYMIEAKLLTDHVRESREKRVLVLNGCGRPRDLSDG